MVYLPSSRAVKVTLPFGSVVNTPERVPSAVDSGLVSRVIHLPLPSWSRV